ncbi:MAG: AAA family ATPase [Marinifilaceae bacterium]
MAQELYNTTDYATFASMEEKITGIVDRVTFHSEETGWSVLKVKVHGKIEPITVTVHQTQVFAGATLEFTGSWHTHHKYGQQFKATQVLEQKPASVAALEKYIGSGLIYGVGPAIAKRIVRHFKTETLEVFDGDIERLTEVKGITSKKIKKIKETWLEHQAIRDVMIFLQGHGISTLFAVKIFKQYGQQSIYYVSKKPYQLSKDIYGIGFFSADKIALSVGYEKDSPERIKAAIAHCLAASRDKGHCYLKLDQICGGVKVLLQQDFEDRIPALLEEMEKASEIKLRVITGDQGDEFCYYNKSLYYDELATAERILKIQDYPVNYDRSKTKRILKAFNEKQEFPLSEEQTESVMGIVNHKMAILTGGPGCGKTTTTKALVHLLLKLNRRLLLAAPTGRAAQRMGEVIGLPAKTIHRLLEFNPTNGGFKKNEEDTLDTDILIIDEASMLDIQLTASVLKAINNHTQLLLIGDTDQLPSVGAGNVLKDLIQSETVPCFTLTQVFRQAKESKIITYAHSINQGIRPEITSPFNKPQSWKEKEDSLFIDAEEATQDQLRFIRRSKGLLKQVLEHQERAYVVKEKEKQGVTHFERLEEEGGVYNRKQVEQSEVKYQEEMEGAFVMQIPEKYHHVKLEQLLQSKAKTEELKSIMKRIHPWSALRYGFTATDILVKLYLETIRKYHGEKIEIQILSPMTKGTLGTHMLNQRIQREFNPADPNKNELTMGDRIFRVGDRVIQKKNNYDLEVFNGDIGKITSVDKQDKKLLVQFGKGEDSKEVCFENEHLPELDLAYAITIHKSQGSEFDVVILPLTSQHYNMLYRNLVYTGLTRAKKLAVFIGSRFALGQAVKNEDNRKRQTMLAELLTSGC